MLSALFGLLHAHLFTLGAILYQTPIPFTPIGVPAANPTDTASQVASITGGYGWIVPVIFGIAIAFFVISQAIAAGKRI